ncbi:Chromo domain-containing protein [Heracleum sosnowskyi]|uniref:Chromo domain-containing protein n=1 Tax=Heracleum sosnowskyi TaxID=360622 RepID=A0AAD8H5D7_9APIA|nr:Chromo domain-containing protein [Heracleum sosnowskyi]
MRFGKKGKLSPRFTGPSEILKRVRKVAYEPALPPKLVEWSQRGSCVDATSVYYRCPAYAEYEQVDIQPGLTYKGQPVEITDRNEQVLKDEVAKIVRGLWKIKKWENPLGS